MELRKKLQWLSDKYADPDIDQIVDEIFGMMSELDRTVKRLDKLERLLMFYIELLEKNKKWNA